MNQNDIDLIAGELRAELGYIRANHLASDRLGRYLGWRGAVLGVSVAIYSLRPKTNIEEFKVRAGMRDQDTSDAIYGGTR